VMQATGVYWTALYDVLESYGLEVNVAHAQHPKTLRGRKTDVQECQWLQKLHTFGLLNKQSGQQKRFACCAAICGSEKIWWRQRRCASNTCRRRRLRSRLGAPKAVTAMAHTLARLVYRMLKFGHHYVDQGIEYYEAKYRQQQLRWTAKQAAALNMQLIPLPQLGG